MAALAPTEHDMQLMLAAQVHLGTKNVTDTMAAYVYKRRADGTCSHTRGDGAGGGVCVCAAPRPSLPLVGCAPVGVRQMMCRHGGVAVSLGVVLLGWLDAWLVRVH